MNLFPKFTSSLSWVQDMPFWERLHLQNPSAALIGVFLFIIGIWYFKRKALFVPKLSFSWQYQGEKPASSKIPFFLGALRGACLLLITLALAMPALRLSQEYSETEGIDIILTLDVSGSMLAEDFSPNRLEAAKEVARHFIEKRTNDRIGLVLFAGESFTQCPLTAERGILIELLEQLQQGLLIDGTAIGMGLAASVQRLRKSKSKTKIVILLTDGVNNMGSIDPLTAAELALQFQIKVYTIGVGAKGLAPFPFKIGSQIKYHKVSVDIDEELLTQIAQKTGGRYYRATDNETLNKIFREVDALEKSVLPQNTIKPVQHLYGYCAGAALLLLALELILRFTYFKALY
jgi:Ca-activated chloride channel family protein